MGTKGAPNPRPKPVARPGSKNQPTGKAPCKNNCESQAFYIEIRGFKKREQDREALVNEMAVMLDLFHTCIATEKMPVLNSECDETILRLLKKAGRRPTANTAHLQLDE